MYAGIFSLQLLLIWPILGNLYQADFPLNYLKVVWLKGLDLGHRMEESLVTNFTDLYIIKSIVDGCVRK